jgi:hypothetical protein
MDISSVRTLQMALLPTGSNRPLYRPSPHLIGLAVPLLVRRVRQFIGRDLLNEKLKGYERELRHLGASFRYRAGINRPVLEGFRDYEELLHRGLEAEQVWPPSVMHLAKIGGLLRILRRGMTESTERKYAADLLDVRAGDFLFELQTALNYRLQGFYVDWYPAGQEIAPEFSVQGAGYDFDVECRRFSEGPLERIREDQIIPLVDAINSTLQKRHLGGEIKVKIGDSFSWSPTMQADLVTVLRKVAAGTVRLEIRDILLDGSLEDAGECRFSSEELGGFIPTDASREWFSLISHRDKELGDRPLVLRLQGPQRSFVDFQNLLSEVLSKKAKRQLSKERAGILAVKFEGLDDPSIFNEQPMQKFIRDLFRQKHVAGLVIHGTTYEEHANETIRTRANAIYFGNHATDFPSVAALAHMASLG